MSKPSTIKYSEALKMVSVPSSVNSRRFIPLGGGTYSPTTNNIVRIPLNAQGNSFIDFRNMVLVGTIKNTSSVPCYLDGGASSFISRLQTLSPSGTPLESVLNHNLLYNAMASIQKSRDYYQGLNNILQGSSANNFNYVFQANATANTIAFYLNNTLIGSLATGTAGNLKVGRFLFSTSATAGAISIQGTTIPLAVSGTVAIAGNVATITVATAGKVIVDGCTFETTATANVFKVNENTLTLGTSGNAVYNDNGKFQTGLLQDNIFTANETQSFAIPLSLSTLMKMTTYFPAFLVSGQGVMLELLLSSADQVFFSSVKTTAPNYEISNVEILAPVVQYSEAVVSELKQALAMSSYLNISSQSYLNYSFPYTAGQNSIVVPISIKCRSLKSLFFMFSANQTSADYTIPRSGARDCSSSSFTFQLKTGQSYYPAKPVSFDPNTNLSEALVELLKSVGNLNDIRNGSIINSYNYGLSQSNGGYFVSGIDLESAGAMEFLESGLNSSDGSIMLYLEINNVTFANSGNVQIFALFDNTITITNTGDVLMSR